MVWIAVINSERMGFGYWIRKGDLDIGSGVVHEVNQILEFGAVAIEPAFLLSGVNWPLYFLCH